MPATPNQPVTYLAPTESSVVSSDDLIDTGASQGPPVVYITQYNAIAIEVTPWVA